MDAIVLEELGGGMRLWNGQGCCLHLFFFFDWCFGFVTAVSTVKEGFSLHASSLSLATFIALTTFKELTKNTIAQWQTISTRRPFRESY